MKFLKYLPHLFWGLVLALAIQLLMGSKSNNCEEIFKNFRIIRRENESAKYFFIVNDKNPFLCIALNKTKNEVTNATIYDGNNSLINFLLDDGDIKELEVLNSKGSPIFQVAKVPEFKDAWGWGTYSKRYEADPNLLTGHAYADYNFDGQFDYLVVYDEKAEPVISMAYYQTKWLPIISKSSDTSVSVLLDNGNKKEEVTLEFDYNFGWVRKANG